MHGGEVCTGRGVVSGLLGASVGPLTGWSDQQQLYRPTVFHSLAMHVSAKNLNLFV